MAYILTYSQAVIILCNKNYLP